jgi:RNA polymerase sigma factor (sigma-70 family)
MHHSSVRDFAARRVGVELAQEIVAETFLVAWRRIDSVPAMALPWLYRVALYEIANLRRRQARAVRLHDALREDRSGKEPEDEGPVTDLARRVARAFAALTPRDQEILRLAAWEQLSAAEAAAVLECSVSAYRMRLHRARARLAVLSDAPERPRPQPRQVSDATPVFSLVHEVRPFHGRELVL